MVRAQAASWLLWVSLGYRCASNETTRLGDKLSPVLLDLSTSFSHPPLCSRNTSVLGLFLVWPAFAINSDVFFR